VGQIGDSWLDDPMRSGLVLIRRISTFVTRGEMPIISTAGRPQIIPVSVRRMPQLLRHGLCMWLDSCLTTWVMLRHTSACASDVIEPVATELTVLQCRGGEHEMLKEVIQSDFQ